MYKMLSKISELLIIFRSTVCNLQKYVIFTSKLYTHYGSNLLNTSSSIIFTCEQSLFSKVALLE